MSSIELTLGNTVKSFPLLAENPSKRVQKAVRRILEKTVSEVVRNLKIPGKDYNDRTFKLRRSWRRRRLRGYRYKVWNPTDYASFIENGTYKIEARKMLHREIYNARARLRRRLSRLNDQVSSGRVV
jgi:hypothetical protein